MYFNALNVYLIYVYTKYSYSAGSAGELSRSRLVGGDVFLYRLYSERAGAKPSVATLSLFCIC